MLSNELEEFARVLVGGVRDVAIEQCWTVLNPDARFRLAQRWRDLGGDEKTARFFIPIAVDTLELD
jgi:hypothetical protein